MSGQGKNVQVLAMAVAGTGAQPHVTFQLGHETAGSSQVTISATATVIIEGRLSPEADWAQLASATTPGTTSVNLTRAWPQMRVNITANTGTVSVWVMA